MIELPRRLLAEAAAAKQVRAYWETVASILSEQAGSVGVELVYAGVNEASTVVAGPAGRPGDPVVVRWEDGQRRVQATLARAAPRGAVRGLPSRLAVAPPLPLSVRPRAQPERGRGAG